MEMNADNLHNIYLDTKPTNHYQYCPICKKDLKKGDKRVSVKRGEINGKYDTWYYYHLECFCYAIVKRFKGYLKTSKKIMDKIIVENL